LSTIARAGFRGIVHPWPARDAFDHLKLDPVSSAIHGLHGMSSIADLDPVSSAIHGLHGMSSS
jgi:hypothetical protein